MANRGSRYASRLTNLSVERLKTPGRHPDGAGLYLNIKPTIAKSWVFRFRYLGKEKEMGLGSTADVSIVEARDAARLARLVVREGKKPIVERNLGSLKRRETPTFRTFAEELCGLN